MDQLGESSIAADALKGALAGAVGVIAMDYLVTWPMYRNEDRGAYKREKDAQVEGKWAAHAVVSKTAKAFGKELTHRQEFAAGKALHFMMGVVPGAIYGVLRKRMGGIGAGRGLAFGAALFLLADEIVVPALGFASGPRKYPWQAHARGLLGHLALGVAADATLRAMPASSSGSIQAGA